MLLLLLIIIVFIYYFKNTIINGKVNENITVSCNESDISCKMYNPRDIQSKCQSLCVQENPKYVFTGTHKQIDSKHTCECSYPIEKFTLDFTNVGEHPDILPDVVPSDMKFSDRNYLEKEEGKRYHDLIFGNA